MGAVTAPMSRSTRQLVQLVAVAVVALVLMAAYLLMRGGSGGIGADTSAPAARATASTQTGGAKVDPASGLAWVDESTLPAQARETLALIRAGGPYPYPRNDDQAFGNREGILPKKSSGYYKEYTVITPGSDDRGARRIIKGAGGELYYTADHYQSFRRIREGR
jgi:guanyl-specific ribonuclease Sa